MFYGFLETLNRMPNRSWIGVDLVVVPSLNNSNTQHYLECLIPEEVHLREPIQELEAVSLVPPAWEYVEADLPPNRVRQFEVVEACLQLLNQGASNVRVCVVLLKFVPLRLRTIPPDRGDVEHPRAVLDECASLHRECDLGEAQ